MLRVKFDPGKAVEVLLYIAERCPDMYTALKVLYFADREHLEHYGRLICGDSYVAMSHGPVPSGVYDIVKCARGDGLCICGAPGTEYPFTLQDYTIVCQRQANLDMLSLSERRCLDHAIDQYGRMSFGRLRALSHDQAYNAAQQDDYIPMEALIQSLPNGQVLLDYLQDD